MALEIFGKFGGEVQDRLIEQAVRGLGSIDFGAAMGWWQRLPPDKVLETIDGQVTKCETPIEAYMAVELGFLSWNPILYRAGTQSRTIAQCWYVPQREIGSYRVDFSVRLHVGPPQERHKDIVIECDGHDFHERTKEQAKRDRGRDRTLLTWGLATLRFTGSELYQSPADCADQIAEYLATLVPQLAQAVAA